MNSKPAQNPFKWQKAASSNRAEQNPAWVSLQKHEIFGFTSEPSLRHSSRCKDKKKKRVALLCFSFEEDYIKPLFALKYITTIIQSWQSRTRKVRMAPSWFLVYCTKSMKMIKKNKMESYWHCSYHSPPHFHYPNTNHWEFYKLQCNSEALKYSRQKRESGNKRDSVQEIDRWNRRSHKWGPLICKIQMTTTTTTSHRWKT